VQSDITLKGRTQYQLAQTPGTIQPGYYIWNASVALIGTTGDWQLRGFVKNITNQSYSNFLANGTLAGIVRYVPRDDKRYAGIMLRKDF